MAAYIKKFEASYFLGFLLSINTTLYDFKYQSDYNFIIVYTFYINNLYRRYYTRTSK